MFLEYRRQDFFMKFLCVRLSRLYNSEIAGNL